MYIKKTVLEIKTQEELDILNAFAGNCRRGNLGNMREGLITLMKQYNESQRGG